jgi:hypothetical protein
MWRYRMAPTLVLGGAVQQRDAADKVGTLLAEPPLKLISVLGRPEAR